MSSFTHDTAAVLIRRPGDAAGIIAVGDPVDDSARIGTTYRGDAYLYNLGVGTIHVTA